MRIVRVLAKLRAREAVRRHRDEMTQCFFNVKRIEAEVRPWDDELKSLLPPRRQWSRPGRAQRGAKGRSPENVLQDSIYRKVHGIYSAGNIESFEWGRRLREFADSVRKRVVDGDVVFQAPRLWVKRKNRSGKGRCISSYENLSDYVILNLTNRYLTSKLDPEFSKDSYAFRTSARQTYNSAMRRLRMFRKSVEGPLYAANCDIQKLFDVLDHDLILRLLEKRVERLGIDRLAVKIVRAYLRSYNYGMVIELADAANGGSVDIDMPDWDSIRELYGREDLDVGKFGIPQGGALSGLLSNLVLDEVDRAILSLNDERLIYARYCDDAIFVHRDKDGCRRVLEMYVKSLKDLGLPIHAMKRNVRYGAEFYSLKSRGPYEWGRPATGSTTTIPWVSFVGYNINYNGDVRIRKETVAKHIVSMKSEFMRFIRLVCEGKLKRAFAGEDAVKAFLYKASRKSLGNKYAGSAEEIGRCWLSAFRPAWDSPMLLKQLKYVDKKAMSLVFMISEGLGLHFASDCVRRFYSHMATVRSIRKWKGKRVVSLALESELSDFSFKELDSLSVFTENATAYFPEVLGPDEVFNLPLSVEDDDYSRDVDDSCDDGCYDDVYRSGFVVS